MKSCNSLLSLSTGTRRGYTRSAPLGCIFGAALRWKASRYVRCCVGRLGIYLPGKRGQRAAVNLAGKANRQAEYWTKGRSGSRAGTGQLWKRVAEAGIWQRGACNPLAINVVVVLPCSYRKGSRRSGPNGLFAAR
jgi:hypothetical protein